MHEVHESLHSRRTHPRLLAPILGFDNFSEQRWVKPTAPVFSELPDCISLQGQGGSHQQHGWASITHGSMDHKQGEMLPALLLRYTQTSHLPRNKRVVQDKRISVQQLVEKLCLKRKIDETQVQERVATRACLSRHCQPMCKQSCSARMSHSNCLCDVCDGGEVVILSQNP